MLFLLNSAKSLENFFFPLNIFYNLCCSYQALSIEKSNYSFLKFSILFFKYSFFYSFINTYFRLPTSVFKYFINPLFNSTVHPHLLYLQCNLKVFKNFFPDNLKLFQRFLSLKLVCPLLHYIFLPFCLYELSNSNSSCYISTMHKRFFSLTSTF